MLENQVTFLRRPAVEAMTGLSRSTIYALMEQGKFPRQVQLSERAVAWSSSEIALWIESRISASRQGV